MYEETINKIISQNSEIASFWSNSSGWAPDDAAELMSKSRLDWQVELSKTLKIWDFVEAPDAQLILAWANLGALIEGSLKLLLAVYYQDYKADLDVPKRKGEIIEPDTLALGRLKQFFSKKEILEPEWISYIELVRTRRNAIHAFQDKPIGSKEEYESSVIKYFDFLNNIDGRLPYP